MFSPQTPDELKRAVNDCCGDRISSEGKHGPIAEWDVSQVTDMAEMFLDIDTFNSDLSNWDVSRVTDMCAMFADAHSFNQDLSNWDVSRATDMGAMFGAAESFNQDLSYWDVSRVTSMQWMFENTISFNQTLCGAAWVNSKASKNGMFARSPGSISDTVCGTCMLW